MNIYQNISVDIDNEIILFCLLDAAHERFLQAYEAQVFRFLVDEKIDDDKVVAVFGAVVVLTLVEQIRIIVSVMGPKCNRDY